MKRSEGMPPLEMREIIYGKAYRMSRRVTAAAEEMGRKMSEQRQQVHACCECAGSPRNGDQTTDR